MVVGILEKSRRLRNAVRFLFGITTPEAPRRAWAVQFRVRSGWPWIAPAHHQINKAIQRDRTRATRPSTACRESRKKMQIPLLQRSEERRVGKECRARGAADR